MNLFDAFDKDRNGSISREEFQEGYETFFASQRSVGGGADAVDVKVLADDPHGARGCYFAFDRDAMTNALGRAVRDQEKLAVQLRSERLDFHDAQRIRIIKVFIDGNGGATAGNCNGRLTPKANMKKGDWKVGDILHSIKPYEGPGVYPSEESVKEFADQIASRFKVVVWDMDQCAVCRHSQGSLRRTQIEEFASKASPDFIVAVKELARRKIPMAVATHSDLAEHSLWKPRNTHVLGDYLVHEVLRRAVPEEAHLFFVVAYNPHARGDSHPEDQAKKRHLRTIAAFYGVELSDCAFFDDDPVNCRDVEITSGKFKGRFHAFKSDPCVGFRLTDLQQ